jgi:structural maintenance of chromosome 1
MHGEERSGRRRTCNVGSLPTMVPHTHSSVGLTRLRDNLVAQLQDLNCSKPRGKADENVIAEITRLESAIAVVGHCSMWCIECLQIPVQRFHKEELKHVERELKKLSPELKKVRATV